jgi:glycosyltransferase involved in cell wall biosynthesis
MRKNILFVGHSAHRSGAPIVLLDFLRWLQANDSELQFGVSVVDGGPLLADFRAITNTDVLRRPPGIPGRLVRRLLGDQRLMRAEDDAFARRARRGGYDLAYVNTVVPRREMIALGRLGIPIICHVHELDSAVAQWLGEEGLSPVLPYVSHFIAASAGVGEYLGSRWKIPETKITVVHSFTNLDLSAADFSEQRRTLRSTLGLSDDDVLIGNCGTLDWRKGADLFVQVARVVTDRLSGRRAHFIWLGVDRSSADCRRFVHDMRTCGLSDTITLMESRPNPAEVFAAMDIFALTSREDPFPLVMLEAANMSLPLVCFGASGGGPEFAGADAGLVAPYLDVGAFVDHVVALAGDLESRRTIGAAGRRKVREGFVIENQAPKLRDVILRVAGA